MQWPEQDGRALIRANRILAICASEITEQRNSLFAAREPVRSFSRLGLHPASNTSYVRDIAKAKPLRRRQSTRGTTFNVGDVQVIRTIDAGFGPVKRRICSGVSL